MTPVRPVGAATDPVAAALDRSLPITFFPEAVIRGRDDDTPEVLGAEIPWHDLPRTLSGDLNLVIRDRHYFLHYFHCLEIAIGLFAYCREFLPDAVPATIHFGRQAWNNPDQNDVQKHVLGACFPRAEIVERPGPGEELVARNVVYVDRFKARTTINKFLEPLLPLAAKWGREFCRTVTSRVDRWPDAEPPRCGYIRRSPPRCLSSEVEARVLGHLAALGYQVDVMDFATMSFVEQATYCGNVDLLVGVHGNGLTNSLWLPDRAAVVELFAKGFHAYDYQMLCEIRGLPYLGIDAAENRVYRDWTRVGPATGNNQDGIDEFGEAAMAALDGFVRRHAAYVCRCLGRESGQVRPTNRAMVFAASSSTAE